MFQIPVSSEKYKSIVIIINKYCNKSIYTTAKVVLQIIIYKRKGFL